MPVRASFAHIDFGHVQVNEEFAAKLPICIDIQDVVKNYKSLREL